MPQVLDYGLIQSARKNPDGSISAYMRVASADRPMRYLNLDGSSRYESITRDQLFKKGSIETLKMQVLTLDHPEDDVTPDNYYLHAAGSVGSLIAFDGDYLGVVAAIRSRDAIAAYDAGIRQVSPGYNRKLATTDRDGYFQQLDRDYNHLAIVPLARGGGDIRIKDSLGGGDLVVFDYSQIDYDLVQLWQRSTDAQDLAINRLLTSGELDPKPIDITQFIEKPMTIATITIGNKALQVDSASVDDASKIAAAYDAISSKAEKADKLLAKLQDAEVQIVGLKNQIADSAKDSANFDSKLAGALKEIASAKQQMQMFAAKGIDTKVASACLDACDLGGYKTAVVKAVSPSFDPIKDAAETDPRYKQICDSFSSQFFPDLKLESLGQNSGGATGTLASAMAGVSNGSLSGLPSDDGWR